MSSRFAVFNIVTLLLFQFKSSSQVNQSAYSISIKCPKTIIKRWDDLRVTIILKSTADTGIIIPATMWVSDVEFPIGDICLDLGVKKKDGYKKVLLSSSIDHFGNQEKLTRLYNNQVISRSENLNLYYSLKQGNYRARVLYHASKFNRIEDSFSNWIYFNVLSDTLFRTRE